MLSVSPITLNPGTSGYAVFFARSQTKCEAVEALLGPGEPGVSIAGRAYGLDILCAAEEANMSVYLFRADVLIRALGRLTTGNAQGEEYLTDVIGIIASWGGRVETCRIHRGDEIQSFNTMEELDRINERLRKEPAETGG